MKRRVVAGENLNPPCGKVKLGLECGHVVIALATDAVVKEIDCALCDILPGHPPAVPPVGGWPKAEPPKQKESWEQ